MAELKNLVTQCLNCGNRTLHQILGSHCKTYFDEDGDPYDEVYFLLLKCSTCNDAALHASQELEETQSLWPVNTFLGNDVPKPVQRRYEEAIRVKHHSPSSFAVQIRRGLEALCKEQGHTSGTLSNQLTMLGNALNLPTLIQDVARVSRMLGNKGAHDGDDVSKEESAMLEDFFLALIEYVYIAPAKLAKYQAALTKLAI